MSESQAGHRATLTRISTAGMITLRGDVESNALVAAVRVAVGADMPAVRKFVQGQRGAVLWMAPDEVLILVPERAEVAAMVATMGKALAGEAALVVDVSSARAIFRLCGGGAAAMLARLAPVDFSAAVFPSGAFRRSRLGQVAAAFAKNEDGSFTLFCARSVAGYVSELLHGASGGDPDPLASILE